MIHQVNKTTEYNRYPEIFGMVSRFYNGGNILSFGCSDGTEIDSLRELYIPNATYYGCDFTPIDNAEYLSPRDLAQTDIKFDVIFAMSVLCRFPDSGEYKFEAFEQCCEMLCDKLKSGGWLVIYNATYRFSDTSVYSAFKPVLFPVRALIPQRTKEGAKCEYDEVIFIKK